MSEIPLEINREGRQVQWRRAELNPAECRGFDTLYILDLTDNEGLVYRVRTFYQSRILKLYSLAFRIYLNGETVPRQRIWGEADLREAIRQADRQADKAAAWNVNSEARL